MLGILDKSVKQLNGIKMLLSTRSAVKTETNVKQNYTNTN